MCQNKNAINGQKGGKATQEKVRKAKQANATVVQAKQADNGIINDIVIEKENESDLKCIMEKGAPQCPSEQAINWRSFKKIGRRSIRRNSIGLYS